MYINKATHRQLGLSACKGIARYAHTHFIWISICFVCLSVYVHCSAHIRCGGERSNTIVQTQ